MSDLLDSDFVEYDGTFTLRPVLLGAGDAVICQNHHWVCDVVKDVRGGEVTSSECFTNWQAPGYTPELGKVPPLCHVCDVNPWITPRGQQRPWGVLGYRVFRGEPGYVDGGPAVQYSAATEA